jgi:hypothetical protein
MDANVNEVWLQGLKAAYEAGYYKTESAVGEQTPFPWQGKRCQDCPFWAHNTCRVFGERRSGLAHTCRQFDEAYATAERSVIDARIGALVAAVHKQQGVAAATQHS